MIVEKQYEKIRDISGTFNGNRFAVAEFDTHIQVWDLEKGFVSKFSTNFDWGGNRLSISEDGVYLLVAGYSSNTITAYNIDTGQETWQRKDLKKCHSIEILNRLNNQVFVHLEKQGTHILDIKTGDTLEKLRGVEYYYENPYGNIDLLEKSTSISIVDRITGKAVKNLSKTTFAILDVTFSEDKIICAYSTNPLESISLNNFEKKWEARVIGHFLEIEYLKEIDKILGIRWDYEKGGSKYLCYIDVNIGKVEKEINIGKPIETTFLKQGKFLLTSQGNLYSMLTGQQIKQFNFESR